MPELNLTAHNGIEMAYRMNEAHREMQSELQTGVLLAKEGYSWLAGVDETLQEATLTIDFLGDLISSLDPAARTSLQHRVDTIDEVSEFSIPILRALGELKQGNSPGYRSRKTFRTPSLAVANNYAKCYRAGFNSENPTQFLDDLIQNLEPGLIQATKQVIKQSQYHSDRKRMQKLPSLSSRIESSLNKALRNGDAQLINDTFAELEASATDSDPWLPALERVLHNSISSRNMPMIQFLAFKLDSLNATEALDTALKQARQVENYDALRFFKSQLPALD